MTAISNATVKGDISVAADPAPKRDVISDVSLRVFSITGAMMSTVVIMMTALGDLTDTITRTMSMSNLLVGPWQSSWNTYFQKQLKADQDAIPTGGDGVAKAQAKFNEDNTISSSANTGFSTLSTLLSSQISTLTQSYSSASSISQQLGVSLPQSISQNWVI